MFSPATVFRFLVTDMDADVSFFSSFMVTLLPVTASVVSLVTLPFLSIVNVMLAAMLYPSGAAVSERV